MLQEISLLSEDLLADGADMFPLSEVKFIVAIERLLVLQLISIQRTKLNVIHHDQLSFFLQMSSYLIEIKNLIVERNPIQNIACHPLLSINTGSN